MLFVMILKGFEQLVLILNMFFYNKGSPGAPQDPIETLYHVYFENRGRWGGGDRTMGKLWGLVRSVRAQDPVMQLYR